MEKKRYELCNSAEDASSILIDLEKSEAEFITNIFNRLNSEGGTYSPTLTITLADHKPDREKIWTLLRTPFVMGGPGSAIICTTVDVIERRNINGFDFFSFKTKRGSVKVCEAQTGGIIADSFEQLHSNIAGVSSDTLQKQIDDVKTIAYAAVETTNEEFFRAYTY